MLQDLIPTYINASGRDTTYAIKRSWTVDDHEVAWIETTFYLWDDPEHANPQHEYQLMCDCDFTEGVGWSVNKEGRLLRHTSMGLPHECSKKEQVCNLRNQELRAHLERVAQKQPDAGDKETVEFVMRAIEELVVIEQRHEMIESDPAAQTFGGHFYLQTVDAILGTHWKYSRVAISLLSRDEKLHLNGMVVMTFVKPPKPKRITIDELVAGLNE